MRRLHHRSTLHEPSKPTLDVYFLDYDAKSAMYGNQSAREQRRMIGGRYFNRLPGEPPRARFDYSIETGFQWGSFGNRSIRAWGAGGNIGWTLPGPMWRERFGLQADAISGDKGQPNTLVACRRDFVTTRER
jgi:hypothetical protein